MGCLRPADERLADAPVDRAGFSGIENGLRQRLGVSWDEDRGRVQNPNARHLRGMSYPLGKSLFVEWRSRQARLQHLMTSDSHIGVAAKGQRRAMIVVIAASPPSPEAEDAVRGQPGGPP